MKPFRTPLVLATLCVSAPALAAAPASPASGAAEEAKAIVTELAACGTRHSMSSWSDPKRGIGCGRDVVVRRFGEVATRTGGRLKVIVDKYETSGTRTGSTRTGNVPV